MKKNNLFLIIGGLAVVTILALTFLPNLAVGSLPLLLFLLVCQLMMIFRMGGMQHGQTKGDQQHSNHLSQPTPPPWNGLTREEQKAELKARLSYLEGQSDSSTNQANNILEGSIIQQAETVARAANERHKRQA